jgi:hypothetical protein
MYLFPLSFFSPTVSPILSRDDLSLMQKMDQDKYTKVANTVACYRNMDTPEEAKRLLAGILQSNGKIMTSADRCPNVDLCDFIAQVVLGEGRPFTLIHRKSSINRISATSTTMAFGATKSRNNSSDICRYFRVVPGTKTDYIPAPSAIVKKGITLVANKVEYGIICYALPDYAYPSKFISQNFTLAHRADFCSREFRIWRDLQQCGNRRN